MRPIEFHHTLRQLQEEAKTTAVADSLSTWVGPVIRYAALADLILLTAADVNNDLQFTALSGTPPLISGLETDTQIVFRFPQELASRIPPGVEICGTVIRPAEFRRARINGTLVQTPDGLDFECHSAFTWCRKYIAPSVSEAKQLHIGPVSLEARAPNDPDVVRILSRAVMTLISTVTPNGLPYLSHRGGQPGFLSYDPVSRRIAWTDYLGDGLLLTAGNIRAARTFKLLALDLESGDGVELSCVAGGYDNLRPSRKQRVEPLIQAQEPYEVQGKMYGIVESVRYAHRIFHPRQLVVSRQPVTACSTVDEQTPD